MIDNVAFNFFSFHVREITLFAHTRDQLACAVDEGQNVATKSSKNERRTGGKGSFDEQPLGTGLVSQATARKTDAKKPREEYHPPRPPP